MVTNLYLHWLGRLFYRANGPARWAGAKLVRYQGNPLAGWVESQLEGWLGLEINREKTRVVDPKERAASLDFQGSGSHFGVALSPTLLLPAVSS